MSDGQQRYDKLIDEMPIHGKVARAAEMFQWSRDWLMRQVLAKKGPMSEECLRLEIAMRMYGHEEPMRCLIEKASSLVSYSGLLQPHQAFH